MSRIGKHPVAIPTGVEVQLSGRTLNAKGSLGALSLVISNEVSASVADGTVTIAPKNETKQARAMWGTTRALVNNMVTGVSKGFSVTLEINGVGYRAAVQGTPRDDPSRRLGRLHFQPRDQRRRLSRQPRGQEPEPAARLQPRHRLSDSR
jgi:ribosomal protein L6P/L9E